jgi:hypothetical protein
MAVRTQMRLRVSDQSAHSVVVEELEEDVRAAVAAVKEARAVAVGVIVIKVEADSAAVDAENVVAVTDKMTDADQRV